MVDLGCLFLQGLLNLLQPFQRILDVQDLSTVVLGLLSVGRAEFEPSKLGQHAVNLGLLFLAKIGCRYPYAEPIFLSFKFLKGHLLVCLLGCFVFAGSPLQIFQ